VRPSLLILSAALATTLGGVVWGCGDLLHSTDFVQSDPSENTGPVDFCSWDQRTAQTNAINACTRLVACESGSATDSPNAVGTCVRRADIAYDCQVAPNRPVQGETRQFWDCLWRAKTCNSPDHARADVASCFPAAANKNCEGDATGFTQCEGDVRTECRQAGPALLDPCVASGRSCTTSSAGGMCSGSAGGQCGQTGCEGTQLHSCSTVGGTTTDRGLDCAGYGGQACVTTPAGPACKVLTSAADGGTGGDAGGGKHCTPSTQVSCNGNLAVGCPSGIEETVDCGRLGVNCTAISTGDGWDVSRACKSPSATCTEDRCDGENLSVCIQGSVTELPVTCKDLGLGPCKTVTLTNGHTQATCGDPL